jgi:hypothetical protein
MEEMLLINSAILPVGYWQNLFEMQFDHVSSLFICAQWF